MVLTASPSLVNFTLFSFCLTSGNSFATHGQTMITGLIPARGTKIPRACTTTTEPVLHNKRSHCNEKPVHRSEDPVQPKAKEQTWISRVDHPCTKPFGSCSDLKTKVRSGHTPAWSPPNGSPLHIKPEPLTVIQALRPPHCSSNTPGTILPQGLCTCCAYCLTHYSPNSSHYWALNLNVTSPRSLPWSSYLSTSWSFFTSIHSLPSSNPHMEKFLHLSGMTYLFNVHLSCYSRVTLGKSLLSSEPQFVHLSNWCMSHPGGKPRVDDFVPCCVPGA